MATATVRIPSAKRDILRTIARSEKMTMKEVLSELIDEYAERHQETIDLLSSGVGQCDRSRQRGGRLRGSGQEPR